VYWVRAAVPQLAPLPTHDLNEFFALRK